VVGSRRNADLCGMLSNSIVFCLTVPGVMRSLSTRDKL
jgi:hypothetical protein